MRKALVALGLLAALPAGAHAAGPAYASIVDAGQDEFLLRVQSLGAESRAHCVVSTLACSAVADDFTLATEATPAAALSPDGRYVAYYKAATASDPNRVYTIFDTLTGREYTHTEARVTFWDLLSEGRRVLAFSPDSKSLLYISDKDGYAVPYRVTLANLKGTTFAGAKVISRPYTVHDFGWLRSNEIYFVANREHPLRWGLYRYALGSGVAPTLLSADVSYGQGVRQFGDHLVFTEIAADTAVPMRYSVTNRTVAAFSVPGVVAGDAPKPEAVKAGTLAGAYWPPAQKGNKLLVWLHGGPYRQTSLGYHTHFSYAGYDWILEEATKAGVGVLRLDYPGSFGYGRTFAESIVGGVGTRDIAATDAAIRAFAQARGFSDIYLMGNSYGGYLAPKLLVEKPQTYDGALAVNGVWDWSSLTHQLNSSIFNVHFGGVESDANKNLYAASEILSRLGTLNNQKIIVAAGEADQTIPYAQSKNAADTIKLAGKNVQFLSYPGEDHVFSKKENFESLCRATLELAGASMAGHCELE